MHKKLYVLMGDAGSPHFFKWYMALSKRFKVIVVSWHDSKGYAYENHMSLSVGKLNPRGGWAYLYRLVKLILIIRRTSPDIVNAHFLTSYGFLASLVRLFIKFKFIASAWGSDILITPQKSFLLRSITKFVLNKSDIVTSDSFSVSTVIEQLSKDCELITFPMGIRKEIIIKDSKKCEKFTFVSARTLIKNSNVDEIIHSFNILIKNNINAQLISTLR